MASNEFDPRCCWGFKLVQGAQWISIVELIINGLLLVLNLAWLSPLLSIANVIAMVCCTIALLGLCKKNKWLVLFGVIYHAIAAVALLICACVVLVQFIQLDDREERAGVGRYGSYGTYDTDYNYRHKKDLLPKVITAIAYMLIYGLLCMWIVTVFYSAYQYFKDLNTSMADAPGTQPGIVLSATSSAGSNAAVGAESAVQAQPGGGAERSKPATAPAAQVGATAPRLDYAPAPHAQPPQAPTTSAGGAHEAPPPYEDAVKQ